LFKGETNRLLSYEKPQLLPPWLVCFLTKGKASNISQQWLISIKIWPKICRVDKTSQGCWFNSFNPCSLFTIPNWLFKSHCPFKSAIQTLQTIILKSSDNPQKKLPKTKTDKNQWKIKRQTFEKASKYKKNWIN
jgi:hypothetical protein